MGLFTKAAAIADTETGQLIILGTILSAARAKRKAIKAEAQRQKELAQMHAAQDARQAALHAKAQRDAEETDAEMAKLDKSYNKLMADLDAMGYGDD